MYWILGAEYHKRPRSENHAELLSTVVTGPAPGLLAFDSDTAVGWCRVNPRQELPWLNRRRELAPVDDLPVWSVSCFYVRAGSRGTGVMAALIEGAVDYARQSGAAVLESYPVDTEVEGATRN